MVAHSAQVKLVIDPLIVGYSGVFVLFLFLALGIPVAVAMGVVGIVGMYFGVGEFFLVPAAVDGPPTWRDGAAVSVCR